MQVQAALPHVPCPIFDRANVFQKLKSPGYKILCNLGWIKTERPGLIVFLKQTHQVSRSFKLIGVVENTLMNIGKNDLVVGRRCADELKRCINCLFRKIIRDAFPDETTRASRVKA